MDLLLTTSGWGYSGWLSGEVGSEVGSGFGEVGSEVGCSSSEVYVFCSALISKQ